MGLRWTQKANIYETFISDRETVWFAAHAVGYVDCVFLDRPKAPIRFRHIQPDGSEQAVPARSMLFSSVDEAKAAAEKWFELTYPLLALAAVGDSNGP